MYTFEKILNPVAKRRMRMKTLKSLMIIAVSMCFMCFCVGVSQGFNPQPEPPASSQTPPGSEKMAHPYEKKTLSLKDGRTLEIVKQGNQELAYIIQKNGSRKLANGAFTLSNGKTIKIINGKLFNPQPEPPASSQTPPGSEKMVHPYEKKTLSLKDGRTLEIVERGKQELAYIIQKDGSRKLANGVFTLSNGKTIKIINGKLMDPGDDGKLMEPHDE
jgi:ribosomal protein S6